MMHRAFIFLACFVPLAAIAAPKPPGSVAEFDRLPSLGRLVEGGTESDKRFRTYLVGKCPTIQGPISIFVGHVHICTQDIAGGTPRPPSVVKWKYAARCSGDANTIGVWTERIAPPEKGGSYFSVYPGTEPEMVDRTWYNVWYAVCLDDFNKYPRKQEKE